LTSRVTRSSGWRARKNCHLGGASLACQDYGAVFAGSAGVALGSEGFSAVVAGAS
jgi:hypothetical protein